MYYPLRNSSHPEDFLFSSYRKKSSYRKRMGLPMEWPPVTYAGKRMGTFFPIGTKKEVFRPCTLRPVLPVHFLFGSYRSAKVPT